ncbi:hypothetical protein [Helicobacter pylori]|uniref:hypothetical protein n=1 Tax=Helicobacter pylori TaxID=210 RepID=UPI001ABA6672|nr:hypothetical protein [Helicobacter pylori]
MGSFFSLGKSSNDTQENPKDALKKEEELKKVQEVQEENAKLNRDKTNLAREKDKLADQNKTLIETNQELTAEKRELNNKITGLSTDKENLTKDKENLTTALSNAKNQAEQTSQKLNELKRRHAPCQKLEKLYEVFLEVKDRLNFNFVATTHSAMDLIASVLSDSKYYLESLYNKASQELSDKKSDKGEKLAELFDLLFEYIKDSKFERLKEPSAYDHTCKKLYPEQNTSQKMQRVVLRGYKHNDKVYYTIVDMGS